MISNVLLDDPVHAALREEVEETRMRYGGDRDEALFHYLIDGDHKSLNRVSNMMRLTKLYEKKRKERK